VIIFVPARRSFRPLCVILDFLSLCPATEDYARPSSHSYRSQKKSLSVNIEGAALSVSRRSRPVDEIKLNNRQSRLVLRRNNVQKSLLISIALCGLLLGGCSKPAQQSVRSGAPKNDIEFAKEAFGLLVEGDQAVAGLIDWEHLKMLGIDVGSMYRGLPDKTGERDRFTTGFINGFSSSFKKSGGKMENTFNWREQSRDSSGTIVAADGPGGKVLLITVARIDGQQKVSTLELK
jgi:hypothetical protein